MTVVRKNKFLIVLSILFAFNDFQLNPASTNEILAYITKHIENNNFNYQKRETSWL